jgi:hypothetical protein
MEEKGIVAGQRLPPPPAAPRRWSLGSGPLATGSGLKRETFAANKPFHLHVVVHVLEGVKAKVPFPKFILNHG